MLTLPVKKEIIRRIGMGGDERKVSFQAVGGGSINNCYRAEWDRGAVFCKVNSATKFPHLFGLEEKGLQALGATKAIRVPEVTGHFECDGLQVLLLQFIPKGSRTEAFWKRFGAALARLHSHSAPAFGWEEDNYMGSVMQSNQQHEEWIPFFITCRLQPLAAQCYQKGMLSPGDLQDLETLYKKLTLVFDQNTRPALVHGDLWSGNFLCDENSGPVLIDPAVHYGHPSVDLGMTTLFGGFHPLFYEAYDHHSKLPANHQEQWQVCNLYPLLIHLLLFGRSYLSPIRQTLSLYR